MNSTLICTFTHMFSNIHTNVHSRYFLIHTRRRCRSCTHCAATHRTTRSSLTRGAHAVQERSIFIDENTKGRNNISKCFYALAVSYSYHHAVAYVCIHMYVCIYTRSMYIGSSVVFAHKYL